MTETPFRLATMAPKPPRRRGLLLALAGASAVVVLVAAVVVLVVTRQDAGPPPAAAATSAAPSTATAEHTTAAAPATFFVTGSVTLHTDFTETPASCAGKARNQGISEGAAVSVRGPAGAVIATGQVGAGHVDGLLCVFLFEIRNVPAGQATYTVSVADRPGKAFTESDFRSLPINL